jgi:hypothetical protein
VRIEPIVVAEIITAPSIGRNARPDWIGEKPSALVR